MPCFEWWIDLVRGRRCTAALCCWLLVAGGLTVSDRWVCDTFSGVNSCYSWQNRIVDTELHGSLFHNSTVWCWDVVVIARSLSSSWYLNSHPGLLLLPAPWPHRTFAYCPQLSAKHFAVFPFFFFLAFLCYVKLVSFLAFPSQGREQLLQREAWNTKWGIIEIKTND